MGRVFFVNLASLLSGNVVSQLIQLLGLMFFATIYAPSAFGTLATNQSVAAIFAALFTLQLHLMVPLAKGRDEAEILAGDARVTALTLFIVFAGMCFIYAPLYLMGVILAFIISLNNIHCALLVYDFSFKSLSLFYVFRALSIVSFQYIFFGVSSSQGLLWGGVAGELFSAIFILYLTRSKVKKWSGAKLLSELLKRKAFTVFGTAQELLTVVVYYMPLFFMELKFGGNVSGQYAFASRLVWGPLVVVTASLSQVLIKYFAGEEGLGNFNGIHKLTIKYGIPVMLAFIVVAHVSEYIFMSFLDDAWAEGSKILALSIIWGGVFFLSMPYRIMLRVQRQQKYQLIIDLTVILAYMALYAVPSVSVVSVMLVFVLIAFVQNLMLASAVLLLEPRA